MTQADFIRLSKKSSSKSSHKITNFWYHYQSVFKTGFILACLS
jgi:hypothetical protein